MRGAPPELGGKGSRALSACTSRLLTPGSSSNNWSCASLSFSLPGPYFWMRCNRNRSSKTWIWRCAQWSCRFSSITSDESWEVELGGLGIATGKNNYMQLCFIRP